MAYIQCIILFILKGIAMKKLFAAFLVAGLLTGCGIGDTNTTYERGQIGRQGQTSVGRIISMTQIDIAGESAGGTLVGAGLGGVAGGIAGSSLGGGKGSDLLALAGAAVGALAGGTVGGATQQAATRDTAYEFLIQKGNSDNVISVVQTNELGLRPGDNVVLITIDGTTRIRRKY